jgi:hypothetical protein
VSTARPEVIARSAFDTIRDFDGDGRADLGLALAHTFTVMFGSGGGDFVSAVSFASGMRALGLAWGDFDADGRDDAAVSDGYGMNVLYGARR